jgi:hypothetical protein
VFVEKFKARFNGKIEINVFCIATNGQMLDYVGILAKRRRPTGEDYLVIEPGRN